MFDRRVARGNALVCGPTSVSALLQGFYILGAEYFPVSEAPVGLQSAVAGIAREDIEMT